MKSFARLVAAAALLGACASLPPAGRAGVCAPNLHERECAAPPAERARLLEQRGRVGDALRVLQDVARRVPDSADVFLDVARLSDKLGRRREALDAYRRFVALEPSSPHGHELLAWMELQLQHPDEALAEFRTAVRLGSTRVSVQNGLGWTLSALGRREEALRAFAEAARLDPSDGTIWGQMALEADQLGRPREAVAYWERAIRVTPGYFDRRVEERRRWEQMVAIVGMRPPAAVPGEVAVAATASESAMHAAGDSVVRGAAGATITRRTLVGDGPASSGSGFFVTRTGLLVTNKHVVRGCSSIKVRGDSALFLPAKVVALHQSDDLALLQVDGSAPAVATFRGGTEARPGDDVVAVGYPLNGLLADQVNVSTGSINALAGMYNDPHTLQMSAPVQPGSSGGPLFDGSGNVVGVVVTKLNAKIVADAMGDIPQNVNFALKGSVTRQFLEANAVRYETAPSNAARSHADIGEIGRRVTVLIECWK